MFLGSNNDGPIKSIAGGIGSRSSSTDDSSSSSSSSSGSCSRRDIGPDAVREKEKSCHIEPKSQSDFCTFSANAPSSYKLPTKTETDGGAFVDAGDEQTRLALDLTELHLRPCPPPCPQQQAFSRRAALIMHHSATIYEEEGEFDVLSEYTSSSSSAAGTPNSGNFFFWGGDDFEEKEDSCIKHIPRLGEWKVLQNSKSSTTQQEDGADNEAGSPRQWGVTSGVGLNIVLEEDEAESVNIARHAAIGTLGRKGQQAAQNADPAGSTLRGENRRANARARARAYARARANARSCVRTQVSSTGSVDPPPVRQSQGFSSLGDINSSDVDAPQVRLKSSSDFVYLTPRDQQQLRRIQQRQQIIGEGETLVIKKTKCLDVKVESAFEDNDSDDGLYHSKNGILGARVVDVRVPEEGGEGDRSFVDESGESRSLTPDTGATSISSTSSSGKSCKVESNGGGGVGDGMNGVEHHSVFDRRVRSGKFRRSTSTGLQSNRASIGFKADERSFERSDSFSIFTRNKSHSSVCKGRSQSLKEDSAEGHRQSNGVLRSLSRGIGKVWEKVTADHPEPLPVSRTMTKEERKALRRRRELELLEDWQANSTAELHQVRVVCKEEETVWR